MSTLTPAGEPSLWIVEDLPVGVWVAAVPGGEFVYANRMFSEIMGMGARDDVVVGEYAAPYGIFDREGNRYPEEQMPFVRAMKARQTVVVDDIVIHRSDGARVFIRAQARPVFDGAGVMTHVVIAFIDISREVIAQSARAESELRLFTSRRMEAIGTLAGGIAHDFNNLLASVKLMVNMLSAQESDAEKREKLTQIDQVTDTAVRLTRALLGFAQRGRNLAAALNVVEVVRALDPIIEHTLGSHVSVVSRFRSSNAWVAGDFSQLEQVLLNLVMNARDAMPQGGTLTLEVDRVRPAAEAAAGLPPSATGEYVVLEVSDTGGGIAPELRERIFEPYFTTKERSEEPGFGLGLATVHGIVHGHGGTVEVRDHAPVGVTMRVVLPAIDAPTVGGVASTSPRAARGVGKILVVDDEPMLLRLVARALASFGYEVDTAGDGVEALRLFRERPDAYTAVLLDMMMPRLDGRETYLAMRELRPDIPALLMTGYAFNEAVQRIIDLGVRGYILKPFSLASLGESLSRVIAASTPAE